MPDLGMGIRWLPRPRSARLISRLPVLILALSRGPAIRPCVRIGHSVVNGQVVDSAVQRMCGGRREIVVVRGRNSGVSDVEGWRPFGVVVAHLRDGLGRLAGIESIESLILPVAGKDDNWRWYLAFLI